MWGHLFRVRHSHVLQDGIMIVVQFIGVLFSFLYLIYPINVLESPHESFLLSYRLNLHLLLDMGNSSYLFGYKFAYFQGELVHFGLNLFLVGRFNQLLNFSCHGPGCVFYLGVKMSIFIVYLLGVEWSWWSDEQARQCYFSWVSHFPRKNLRVKLLFLFFDVRWITVYKVRPLYRLIEWEIRQLQAVKLHRGFRMSCSLMNKDVIRRQFRLSPHGDDLALDASE